MHSCAVIRKVLSESSVCVRRVKLPVRVVCECDELNCHAVRAVCECDELSGE